ncbi:hypothetical protein [Streptomyces griseoaurantiacus]|uniref:hypothetical protein n=1 Tax=Streptomyces griseoaurantiacus TaxID=68213 RepID=UPI003870DD26
MRTSDQKAAVITASRSIGAALVDASRALGYAVVATSRGIAPSHRNRAPILRSLTTFDH